MLRGRPYRNYIIRVDIAAALIAAVPNQPTNRLVSIQGSEELQYVGDEILLMSSLEVRGVVRFLEVAHHHLGQAQLR